jgi:hypothetical protein
MAPRTSGRPRTAAPHVVYPEDGSVCRSRGSSGTRWPAPPLGPRRLEELSGRRVVVLGDGGESLAARLESLGAHVTREPTDGEWWTG